MVFVGIATQVADNVEKYSALSDQPGAYEEVTL